MTTKTNKTANAEAAKPSKTGELSAGKKIGGGKAVAKGAAKAAAKKPAAKGARAAKSAERRALAEADYKVLTSDVEFRGLRGAAWKLVAKNTNAAKVIGKEVTAGDKSTVVDATFIAFFIDNGNIKLA